MRIALERVQRQADLVAASAAHPLILLLDVADALDLQRLAQDRPDAHARIQRRVGILEHHLQVTAGPAQIAAAALEDLLTIQFDLAAVGLLDPDDQLAQRRLAAAGLADESEGLARVDGQASRPRPP